MMIIKWLEPGSSKEHLGAFIRRDVDGHLLVNMPIDKPYRKREAKWIDPDKVTVIWIREFIDEE